MAGGTYQVFVKTLTGKTVTVRLTRESTICELKQAIQEVDAAQHTAAQEARNLMTGEATDMHSAILAVQNADVSFQMMMSVRSKLIEAYREVMRMQM